MTIARAAFLALLLAGGAAAAESRYPDYPKARKLCDEHVNGGDMHIKWWSSATTEPLAKVVAHYEKLLKAKAEVDDHDEHAWKVGDHRLRVFPASQAHEFPSCDAKPNKNEKTIILRAQGFRR